MFHLISCKQYCAALDELDRPADKHIQIHCDLYGNWFKRKVKFHAQKLWPNKRNATRPPSACCTRREEYDPQVVQHIKDY